MSTIESRFKRIVATFALLAAGAASAQTRTATLDELFEDLRQPDAANWQAIEDRIRAERSQSGSDAMDLLLERGREAMAAGDTETAIEHFTALTDHAPGFAEGYNARATAYFQAGLFGPALMDIETVLSLNPRHFAALQGLAMIMEELGHPEEALSAYRAAYAIHPNLPHVREAIDRLEDQRDGSEI